FHSKRGDFSDWMEYSLKDKVLAEQLKVVSASDLKGEKLRNAIINLVKKRFRKLSRQEQDATSLF
ncbi:MAG: DUF5752 family protein, partial [Candidatus Bathyarchaeota archaeon]|nr:DUF5752 family protein [Candidatus Bathyarchaeota archaeon]